MSNKNHRLCGIVLVALFLQTVVYSQDVAQTSLAVSSTDDSAIRSILDQYFAAYAREDLEAAMDLWSGNAPDLASRRKAMQELFAANDKFELRSLSISKVKVLGEKATARVVIELSAVDAKSGKPAVGLGKMNRAFDFVNDKGFWKVWREVAAEEELAAALVAAATDEQREALLAADKELMTAELWKALTRQAKQHYSQSNYQQALTINKLALSIAERINDKEGIAQALNDTAAIHDSQGNYGLALENFQRSLMLRTALGDKANIGVSLANLGSVYGSLGNHRLATEYYRKAFAELEPAGHKVGLGAVLLSIGNSYYSQGNYGLALENYDRALKYLEAAGHTTGVSVALNNIGNVYQKQGDPSALDYYQKSLKLKEASGNKTGIAASLQNIGIGYRLQSKYDLALENLKKSFAQFEAIGEKRGQASSLGEIGLLYYLQGDYTKALEFTERASVIASTLDAREIIWEIRTTAGKAYRALNQPVQARKAFEEAIANIEDLRAWVAGGEREQQRFFENKVTPYHEMIALLIDQENPTEALSYAEQAKARVLLDVLRRGRVDVTKTMTPHEREQETKLKNDLILLNKRILRERQQPQVDQAQLTSLQAQLDKARLEYEGFQSTLYATHPDLKARRGEVRSVTPAEITTLLSETGGALIEYVVTEQKTYLFVAMEKVGAKSGTLTWKAHTIDIKRKDLSDKVESFRQQLAKRDLTFREQARGLFDLLLKPIEPQLTGNHALVIVPDGPLWELPFQALQGQRRYLVEDHAISYAPSLSVLREMAKLRSKANGAADSRRLLGFGNPALGDQKIDAVQAGYRDDRLMPLPEAEREVKALARLYGDARSTIYIGVDAREERLKVDAKKHRILQLAAHALLNDASPMYSHVLLAQGARDAKDDGLLEAWEMMNLDLRADLVVLSACETGRGRIAAGEGVIGMTWALFVAGSPTTVVSLWKVESLSTTELMLEFHRNLLSGTGSRPSKATALQRAAIRMLKTKDYRHPFYWAGFSVIGDGN